MVFIAYNYESKIIGIVNARSKELANAYWQGKDLTPHVVKCLEDPDVFTPIETHVTGVYPILTTSETQVNVDGFGSSRTKKIITVN